MFLLVQMTDWEIPFCEKTFFFIMNINYILKIDMYLQQKLPNVIKIGVVNIFTLLGLFYNMISVYKLLNDIPFC